jgi:hypothetical protein
MENFWYGTLCRGWIIRTFEILTDEGLPTFVEKKWEAP